MEGGRAVVFHNANGARVACGLILPSRAEVSVIGAYPGNNRVPTNPHGILTVEDTKVIYLLLTLTLTVTPPVSHVRPSRIGRTVCASWGR